MDASHGPGPVAETDALRRALVDVLSDYVERSVEILWMRRSPVATASSYPVETLELAFSGGVRLEIIFKDLSPESLSDVARRTKPEFLLDPEREICVYQHALHAPGLGTPACYGALVDPQSGRYWLFLERVPGVELYQVGDLEIWQRAARWFATLHREWSNGASNLEHACRLIRYDDDYYRAWPGRAYDALQSSNLSSRDLTEFTRIVERYDSIIDRLRQLDTTLIHGESYASNILVHESDGVRICPIDWEMAAIGPGMIDLAALVSGRWTEPDRRAIALAYFERMSEGDRQSLSEDELFEALDCCRLHLAMQWPGWSQGWTPPPDYAHDWLSDALDIARRLGLGQAT